MALKTIAVDVEEARHQFARELKVLQENLIPLSGAKADQSPCDYILGFYDAYTQQEDNSVVMAVEYMNGGSLDDHIKRDYRLSEEELGSIAFQCLRGIAFLNDRKQMHRDIKPANILLNSKGRVKISDFGTARQLASTLGGDIAMVNTFVGTVMYMAPERIKSNEYSYEADIWSLGLSLFTAAEAEFPYNVKKGYWGLANIIVNDPAPHLPETGKYSPEFIDLLDQMLVKDYKARKQAAELLHHPFIVKAVQKSENVGLPIPKFLLMSIAEKAAEAKEIYAEKMKLRRDDDYGGGKEDDSLTRREGDSMEDDRHRRDSYLSPVGSSKSEKSEKRLQELETIAMGVAQYWSYKDEKSSRSSREMMAFCDNKKLAKLGSELHLPASVVKLAFENAAARVFVGTKHS
jgi:serine/threonine protein kinase